MQNLGPAQMRFLHQHIVLALQKQRRALPSQGPGKRGKLRSKHLVPGKPEAVQASENRLSAQRGQKPGQKLADGF